MPPITSQPGQSPPPSYNDVVQPPLFNPEVITLQPISAATETNGVKITEEVAEIAPTEEILGEVPENQPRSEVEERRTRKRDECCDPYPEYTGDDVTCWICCIRGLCNPCRLFCWCLGECARDCCQCCKFYLNCCESNPRTSTNNDGCCGDCWECCCEGECNCCGDCCGGDDDCYCCGDGSDGCCGTGPCGGRAWYYT